MYTLFFLSYKLKLLAEAGSTHAVDTLTAAIHIIIAQQDRHVKHYVG